jgi:hypothetical protein
MQAAYNNEAQFDLNEHLNEGIDSVQHNDSASKWSIGTKVLKQFETEWFNGAVQKYYGDDNLYWILYEDGDSEDMDPNEVEQAIADYRSRYAEESVDDVATEYGASVATSSIDLSSVAAASASVTEAQSALTAAANNDTLPSADVVAAIQAMTRAAERLACAADRLEEVSRTQHVSSDNVSSSTVQQTLLQQQQLVANHQRLLREQQCMQQQQLFAGHQQLLREQYIMRESISNGSDGNSITSGSDGNSSSVGIEW